LKVFAFYYISVFGAMILLSILVYQYDKYSGLYNIVDAIYYNFIKKMYQYYDYIRYVSVVWFSNTYWYGAIPSHTSTKSDATIIQVTGIKTNTIRHQP